MSVQYAIDLTQKGREFPHYWEMCVGSCHAATLLREDVREQIRKGHAECGFRYIRFHGLLDDDMSVAVREMFWGDVKYHFYNIDSIFDFLLETGMKPFIELGFMPTPLASGTATCMHYKGNITLPKRYEDWADLITNLAKHLIERYGEKEVESWYFEVWNEPNLNVFFEGSREDYFQLYRSTVTALKAVDSKLRVGGPATSSNAWIPQFISYCEGNDLPIDFITTHHYPSDDLFADFGGTKDDNAMASFRMPTREDLEKTMTADEIRQMITNMSNRPVTNNPKNILRMMAEKAKKEAGNYPLIYTEWNGGEEYDTSYQAAAVAQILADNEGLVEGYSYWTLSDIFEEMGLHATPFMNTFGMMTKHSIRKPVYRVFETLHMAGDYRLDVAGNEDKANNAEVLALSNGEKVLVMVYNHDIVRRTVKTEEVSIRLKGSIKEIKKSVIDDSHCNPRQAWIDMGSPEYLNDDQVAQLNQAAELCYEDLTINDLEMNELLFTAEPESVTIFWITLYS